MTVKAWSSIGPAQVIAEETVPDGNGWSKQQEIARITIPDKDLPDAVAILLSRCYQQNLKSDLLMDCLKIAGEVYAPQTP